MPKISHRGYNKNRNILIERNNAIYFYIPKNGCTTFKTYLIKELGDVNYNGSVHKYNFPFSTSAQLKVDHKNYMKFAFVRNPWSRLVSCYKNKIRSSDYTNEYFEKGVHRGFNRFNDLFYAEMPFKEFAEAVCTIPDSISDPHFVSQLFWLTDNEAQIRPNYIGKLENLRPSFDDIYNQTGLFFSNLKKENSSTYKSPYQSFYNVELVEKVGERYRGDVEMFQYEFDTKETVNNIGSIGTFFSDRLAASSLRKSLLEEKIGHLRYKLERVADEDLKKEFEVTLQEMLDAQIVNKKQTNLGVKMKLFEFFGVRKNKH